MKILLLLIFIASILFLPNNFIENEFPTFRVVLDPGHGGVCRHPQSVHGDRYDPISKQFLELYREGAAYGIIKEHKIVYEIARKVHEILQLCSPGSDYVRFNAILRKYTDEEPGRINIIAHLDRDRSLSADEASRMEDPNSRYRLFDYADASGRDMPGRLSVINSYRPHLVVSLHVDNSPIEWFQGMTPVIAAPYRILNQGLLYLRGNIKTKDFYTNSHYSGWFEEATTRTDFKWFLNDVSLYFTAHPLDNNLNVERNGFKGYRHNMLAWPYRDCKGWEKAAQSHPARTQYSWNYLDVVPEGKFWDRERSKFEAYRRDGGTEGFGGDNAYASYEIIRFAMLSLYLRGYRDPFQRPGKPYTSVWIVPLHVNAVNAFIELGYLNRPADRYVLTYRQNEIAEGIAVGIYSLLAGLKPRPEKFRYLPSGKRIDLEKYNITRDKSYFDAVAD